jgi:hypothetical protein
LCIFRWLLGSLLPLLNWMFTPRGHQSSGAPESGLTLVSTISIVNISYMWTSQRDYLEPVGTLRLRFSAGHDCLSYADFLRALAEDASFRELIQDEMRAAPFIAFRWETPPLTSANIDQPFECLLHDSPGLDVRADPTDFEAYFQPGAEVVNFQNLGADALLIVPCPISKSANYSHIAAFHRSAPFTQQHAFWIVVAQTVLTRLGPQPLWLSTAGGGVDWLHMRLDDRPKYYRYLPWREAEDALPAD